MRKTTRDTLNAIPDAIQRYGHVTLGEIQLPGKKLGAVHPEFIDELGALDAVDHLMSKPMALPDSPSRLLMTRSL